MEKLNHCPHCGKPVELIRTQYGFAIICTDHTCLGGMEIRAGLRDDEELFKRKLIANWNKRQPEIRAVDSAIQCIENYGDELYQSMQEPYDEHGQCCIDVVNEILNRLMCFTCQEAVDAWQEKYSG